MQGDHGWQAMIPAGDGVPARTRRVVEVAMQAAHLARLQRREREARALEAVRARYVRQVRRALGATRYERYRATLAELRAEQAAALHPPRGPKLSLARLAALGDRRRRASAALQRKLGLKVSALKAIGLQAQARIDKTLAPLTKGKGAVAKLVLPNDVPMKVLEGSMDFPAVVAPPYEGWGTWYEWNPLGAFTNQVVDHTNKDTGQVGNSNGISIHDASDIDICSADFRTSIGFWFKMPKTGLVEVWIEAQLGTGLHDCHLDDEWGVSDATSRQWSYLTLQTWGTPDGALRLAEMSSFYEVGCSDGDWSIQFLTSGSTYWAHLVSDVVYAKDAWVYVDIGVHNRNYVYTNDVEDDSRVDFNWFIPSVTVGSTG